MKNNWSVPESDLIGTIGECLETGQPAVLATIIHVEGSAYRRPGAKMLLPESGQGVGSITAGCLENELVDLAESVLAEGDTRIETFDLTGDDDIWGLGIGCNGVIDIMLEPLTDDYTPIVDAFEHGNSISLVTVLDDEQAISGRGLYQPQSNNGFSTIFGEVSTELIDRIQPLLETATNLGSAETLSVDNQEVFIDGITPPPRLLLIGHGHDVGPVVDLGNKNDFRVEIATFRGASKAADRFPDADEIHTTSPVAIANDVTLDENTYVLIMSHNFVDDQLAFETVLETPVPYIGLLGPRERFEEMVDSGGNEEGIEISAADVERIYTPIGLDLGGGTPYQIAHSIVAEVLAVHNERDIKHLRDRDGPIHERLSINSKASGSKSEQ